MVKEIYSAIDNLEMNVDLNEVINVPDRILRDAIKETLELTSNTIHRSIMAKYLYFWICSCAIV